MGNHIIRLDSENSERHFKIPLSVTFVAKYLRAGKNQSEVARIAGVSRNAVSKYIRDHYSDLAPLLDETDGLLALQCKHIAHKAVSKIDDILDTKLGKKNLSALNSVSDTHIEKYRLLSDKSTTNVSYADLTSRTVARQAEIDKLRKEVELDDEQV